MEIFSEILVEGTKRGSGDSLFCFSSVGVTCWGWSISYSLVSYFLKLGIWLWTECVCLCIWNISLLLLPCFCSWVLQLITQVLMFVVSLRKTVVCKLKILGVGNLNIINQWGEPQKVGNQILKFQWGKAKGVEHSFWLKFNGVKNLGGNYRLWVFFKLIYKTKEN